MGFAKVVTLPAAQARMSSRWANSLRVQDLWSVLTGPFRLATSTPVTDALAAHVIETFGETMREFTRG
jgi:hypothetical protein